MIDRIVLASIMIGLVTLPLFTAPVEAEADPQLPVIMIAAKDVGVTPMEGQWNESFCYTISVRFYNNTEIALWIYNPAEHVWKTCGVREYRVDYAGNGGWQMLSWNVTPFCPACEAQSSSFKFIWQGTVLEIDGREIHVGPAIVPLQPEVKLRAGAVSYRGKSTYKTEFNYSVEVNASKAVDVELEVYDPCLDAWKSMGIAQVTAGRWYTLSWNTTKPFGRCRYGLSKFKFNAYYRLQKVANSTICEGPQLVPLLKLQNPCVEPSRAGYDQFLTYHVEIVNVSEYIDVREITLYVLNPHRLSWTNFNQTARRNNTLIWSIKPFGDDSECKGIAGFYFTYDNESWPEVLCYGPEIISEPPPLEERINTTR
jgi:hypothetical protein